MAGVKGMKSRGPDHPPLGGNRPGAGRPLERITLRVGDVLTVRRDTTAERWTVTAVSKQGAEFSTDSGVIVKAEQVQP